MPLFGSLFFTAHLCSAIRIFRVLFDSPVYTWLQLLQGIWYTTPVLLSPGTLDFTLVRVCFRVHAEVKMERMPRGARVLSSFALKPRTQGVCKFFFGSSDWESSVDGGGEDCLGEAWRFFVTSAGEHF